MARLTFNEQLYNKKPAEVRALEAHEVAKYGIAKALIADPLIYDTAMKRIPCGKLTTTDRVIEYLVKKYNAEGTCPLTGGIYMNLVANASDERQGKDETPYWRTLKKDGELNERYPGGIEAHRLRLESEGHKTVQKGKRHFVVDYQKALHKIDIYGK
jgi:hypothetical protein